MEGLLGGRLQLDSRPELEPFVRLEDRLLNASRGEQAADGRIREHRAGLPATQKSINLEWMPAVEKNFPYF